MNMSNNYTKVRIINRWNRVIHVFFHEVNKEDLPQLRINWDGQCQDAMSHLWALVYTLDIFLMEFCFNVCFHHLTN